MGHFVNVEHQVRQAMSRHLAPLPTSANPMASRTVEAAAALPRISPWTVIAPVKDTSMVVGPKPSAVACNPKLNIPLNTSPGREPKPFQACTK